MAALITGIQSDLLRGLRLTPPARLRCWKRPAEPASSAWFLRVHAAAYGHIDGANAHPTYEPITEDHPQRPFLVYDVCKVASEGMGRNYARMRGLQFVALRFAQIYGPGKLQRHGPYGLFSRLVESPLAGRPVKIPRGGDQRDDVIYVDDIAEAIVLAVLHPRPAYDAYNISRGVGTTLHDFADAVRKVVPKPKSKLAEGSITTVSAPATAASWTTRAPEGT